MRVAAAAGVLLLCLSGRVAAAPLLAIDADPGTAGIQSLRVVPLGAEFEVDVVVSSLDPAQSLHAYEFDLGYGPAVVRALDVGDGGFIPTPIFELVREIALDGVRFSATTIGELGSSGDGRVAVLRFTAEQVGESTLGLADVILSEPFGIEIPGVQLGGALIQVVPEPGVFGLALCALLVSRVVRPRGWSSPS